MHGENVGDWSRFGARVAPLVALAGCGVLSGLSGYSTGICSDACTDGGVLAPARDAGADGVGTGPGSGAGLDGEAEPDAEDDGGFESGGVSQRDGGPETGGALQSDGGSQSAGEAGACSSCDAACVAADGGCGAPTGAFSCAAGGCNASGGACSAAGEGCYCHLDGDCLSGRCVAVAGQNDVSCASACTGTGATDGFDCLLASPGIPAAPTVTAFGFTPSNFSPTSYAPPSSPTTINCNTTYNSTSHAFTGWCSGQTQPVIVSGVTQSRGPNVDVLVFAGLTLAAGDTLTLTGGNAVVVAVYGNATISGAIHADGAPGTSGGNTSGASGPGGGYDCGNSAGQSSGDGDDDGGGGGGASANGGAGGAGVFGTAGAAGTKRANTTLNPLYGGCPGGNSGSWACTTSGGGGGGAVQISAAGTLLVTGTITAVGGTGGTSTCSQTQAICNADYPGGGGGGGSGGAILLEGASVTTSGGTLSVNGGVGGNPEAGMGVGGAGGTASSTNGAPGTGSAGACGSADQAAGGGGGGYGYLTVNSNEQAPAYACSTSLSPAPVSNAAGSACLCVADSDCSSRKCVNSTNQCTGTCTGTGAADDADCQTLTSTTAD